MSEKLSNQSITEQWARNAKNQRARFADYALDPAHTITTTLYDGLARVIWNSSVIAESVNAIELHERKHDPVFYFPQKDVKLKLFTRTGHATHCPYKGDASYWSLNADRDLAENAAWAYESPIEAMSTINGFMAFYLDAMGKKFGLILETT
ncbi:MAG: DUF427 domain-containing protein [Rhodospirillales bacterium]|jgi:uncharacterized protein (DUF427 family)